MQIDLPADRTIGDRLRTARNPEDEATFNFSDLPNHIAQGRRSADHDISSPDRLSDQQRKVGVDHGDALRNLDNLIQVEEIHQPGQPEVDGKVDARCDGVH